uniref:PAZ domain-containing protein n=1 Tax=Panagrolaimus davidi TaxID=227884 RepID=A0A914QI97_9BILA
MSSEASTSSNTTAANVSSSMQQQTRADEKDDAGRQCMATLNRLGLEPGDQVTFNKEYATRGIIRNGDTLVKLSTNIFDLQTTACDVFQYHIEFEKVCENGPYAGKSFPFVDPSRRSYDYTTVKNRQWHGKLLTAFINKYPNVFGNDPDHFCYDCATTLYSLVELVPLETPMFLTKDETAAAIHIPVKITLTVKKPENNVFNVRDLMKNKSLDLSEQPLHILRFLELATSRHASLHPEHYAMFDAKKTYFMKPQEHGFDIVDLKRGKYLAAGASKTVACIEGSKNKGVPALVIDSKKTPFFHSMNLLQMLCASANVGPEETVNGDQLLDLVSLVNHLEVLPIYGNRKTTSILLSGLTQSDANRTFIEYNDAKISIAQYFFQRYGIALNYPHWPLATGAKKVEGCKPYFPLELLVVAEFQRIGNANITSVDIANIVRACAVAPATKDHEILNCYESFSFAIDPFMKKAGISVVKEPLKVPARVLKAPQIRYANGTLCPESNGKWRLPKQAKYEICATLKRWLGIFLIVPNERMAFEEFVAFVQRFYEECGIRGLQIDEPYDLRQVVCDAENIEAAFRFARDEGCEYILFGHSDRDTKFHSFIKSMERKYEVITQCVKTKTVYNIMEQSPVSLENIVAKANVKLGGLNHSVVLADFPF